MSEEILNSIFTDVEPESKCLRNLRIGLDKLGMVQVTERFAYQCFP